MSKTKSEPKAHATYSASGSERWLECPGSIQLNEKLKAQGGGDGETEYAAEGTTAHELHEFLLQNRANIAKAIITARASGKYNEEMIYHVEASVREILDRLRKAGKGAELVIEARCDLPVSEPDQFGTTDAAIVEDFGLLEVIDFKYGAGVAVSAEENSQLIYYALGLAHRYNYNFERVRLTVIQPRKAIDGAFVRSWDTTVENLLEWKERFERGIQECKKPKPKFMAGDHCRFCSAKIVCKEFDNKALRSAQIAFADDGDAQLPKPPSPKMPIPLEKLPKLLAAFPLIEQYIEAVREYAFEQIKAGSKVDGWKLVEKRSVRKYNDVKKAETAARRMFGMRALSLPELLSPAQLEKAVGKDKADDLAEFLSEHVSSVSSGLTIAPDKDGRKVVDPFKSFGGE
jgi:hypothetical protein